MRLWYAYGSEHSANLVIVGRFLDPGKARMVKDILASIATEHLKGGDEAEPVGDEFSNDMIKLLREAAVYSLSPDELEQFRYDYHTELTDGAIRITTDEIEISSFLKILISKGARIEVYSADDYPDSPAQKAV